MNHKIHFYCGNYEEDFNMLDELSISLEEWESYSEQEQSDSIDKVHDEWMYGSGYAGWSPK